MLPPPSPHKAGREHRRRAPLSRLQESAGGSGGTQDGAAVEAAPPPPPTFQSPSKHRFSLPHAPPSAAAALCSPPRVVTAGGAIRVLTPAKAGRSRSSVGGTKRRHGSSGGALDGGAAGDAHGTPSSDSSSGSGSRFKREKRGVSISSSSARGASSEDAEDGASAGAACAGSKGRKEGSSGSAGSSSYHRYGAARRVSSRSSGSGGGGGGRRSEGGSEREGNADEGDGEGRGGPRMALGAARVSTRKASSSSGGSNRSSGGSGVDAAGGGGSGTKAAAADRRTSESSRRVSTTLRRVSGSRAGVDAANNRGSEADAGKGAGSHRHPAGAAAAAASLGSKGGERGSLELAGGGVSSWGTLGLARDGPRRVSTWSNNSGGSTSSSATSGTSGGRAGVKNGPLPGRLSDSRSNGNSTGISNRNSSTGGSSGSGGAAGETERSGRASRRISAARCLVGVACKECGEEKVGGEGGRGGEGPLCEDCAADVASEGAERRRPAARRAREGSGGVTAAAQPSRRRSGTPTAGGVVTAGAGRKASNGDSSGVSAASGDARLGGQDPARHMCIDDFQVGSKLGKGKFGIVYKAKCKVSKKTVAIKMIYKSYLRDGTPQDRVNLDRERRLQAQVRHPNIVGVQNCFQAPKFVYLVLDYAAGGDMFKVLSQHKNGLPVETAAAYLRDAAAAVDHLHSVHIMHRDIKAENLLLDSKGRLKLSDFGWAVLAKPPLDHRQTMCGTPEYAAPEIVACNRTYTKAVDIWSLGVLAFELLTGQTPFASPMIAAKNQPAAASSMSNTSAGASGPGGLPAPFLEKPHNVSDTAQDGAPAAAAAAAAEAAAAAAVATGNAATAAEIEAVHRGDVHAQLYGRIAGWSGSRDSLFGEGTRGESVPEPARDVVMGMLKPRAEDRLASGEVLRLPWVSSRGRGADVGVVDGVPASRGL